jgi:predicted nuclease with TOPRIM domain
MARIEISIEEYNAYNDKIKKLESELAEMNNKLNNANNTISDLKEGMLYIAEDVTFFDRLFKWKIISQTILKEIKK